MKKYVAGLAMVLFAAAVLLPAHSLAADENGTAEAAKKDRIELKKDDADTETIAVELSRPSADRAGMNALRMSFRILTNESDTDITFRFGENAGDEEGQPPYIASYRYHPDEENEKEGTLSIYAASADDLFQTGDSGGDSVWRIGRICAEKPDGVTVRACLIPESVEAAYGDRAQQFGSNMTEIVYPDGGKSVTVKVGSGGSGELPAEEEESGPAGDSVRSGGTSPAESGTDKTPENYEKELQRLLDELKSDKAKDYTVDSYQELQEAIRRVEKILARRDATPEELEAALIALQNAKAGLVAKDSADSGARSGESVSRMSAGTGEQDHVPTGDGMDVYVYTVTALLSLLIASAAYRLKRKYE